MSPFPFFSSLFPARALGIAVLGLLLLAAPRPALSAPVEIFPICPVDSLQRDLTLGVDGRNVPIGYTYYSKKRYARVAVDGPKAFVLQSVRPIDSAKTRIYPVEIARTVIYSADKRKIYFVAGPGRQVNIEGVLLLQVTDSRERMVQPSDADVIDMGKLGLDNTGKTLLTARIQAAIDSAAKLPQRKILYFPNGTYLTATLLLRNNSTLYLAPGALLKCFSKKIYDYRGDVPGRQNWLYDESLLTHGGHHQSAFILIGQHGYNKALTETKDKNGNPQVGNIQPVTGAKIFGYGFIDGAGREMRPFTDQFNVDSSTKAIGIRFKMAERCTLMNVQVRNAGEWAVHVAGGSRNLLRNLQVLNFENIWGDGIDLDGTADGIVDNCIIHAGDDGFTFKNEYYHYAGGPNIRDTVRNTQIYGYGLKPGWALTRLQDILFENVYVLGGKLGVEPTKMRNHDPSKDVQIRNITFRNVTVHSGGNIQLEIGFPDKTTVENFKFVNLNYKGKQIASASDPDFAAIKNLSVVKGVTVSTESVAKSPEELVKIDTARVTVSAKMDLRRGIGPRSGYRLPAAVWMRGVVGEGHAVTGRKVRVEGLKTSAGRD